MSEEIVATPKVQPENFSYKKQPKINEIQLAQHYSCGVDGCFYLRTAIPFMYMTSSMPTYINEITMVLNSNLNILKNLKVFRMQRQYTPQQMNYMVSCKDFIKTNNKDCNIIYELDDLVHCLPSYNIATNSYTEVHLDCIVKMLREADLMTTTTQTIADYYREKFGIKNIKIIPNYLAKYMWKFPKRKYKINSMPRILYAGSASHFDMKKIGDSDMTPIVELVKKTYRQYRWIFLGNVNPEIMHLVEFHKWCNIFDYPQKLRSLDADLAVVPLKNNIFNRGKSDLKLLEMSALGIPCICDNNITYPSAPVIVEHNQDDFEKMIDKILTNKAMYEQVVSKQYDFLDKRWLEDNMNDFVDLFKKKEGI